MYRQHGHPYRKPLKWLSHQENDQLIAAEQSTEDHVFDPSIHFLQMTDSVLHVLAGSARAGAPVTWCLYALTDITYT